ncbi:MAG: hypothetical protein EOO24_02595, partial [Comamonadaceae bacterium]
SIDICLPGIASSEKRAPTSATRSEPFVITTNCTIVRIRNLPFIVIDLVISNILMAMGMMMVSPVTISLPLKLFLFVMVDGWSRLLHGLVQTFR